MTFNQSAKMYDIQGFLTWSWISTSTLIIRLSKGLHLQGESGRGQGESYIETGGQLMYGP